MDFESKTLFSHKIKTVEQLKDLIKDRPRKNTVIMCHGTFDVVHPGHIRHLLFAKSKADILIASLTADMHIAKGNMRPYVPEDLRAINLAALEMVDYVVIDRDPTPLKNLSILRPDLFAKGYEYTAGSINTKTQEEISVIEGYGGELIFTPGDIVYSSSALIELSPPSITVEKLMILMAAEEIKFSQLRRVLENLNGIKIHVVGDTIVDSYTYCTMIGGMTKTPTMSVRLDKKVNYTGGAAVVAKHLRAAGADVTFSTILGNDEYKDFIINDLNACGVNVKPIIDPTRPTTNKNAIVAESYRLLKVDTLDNRSITEKMQDVLIRQIEETSAQAIVFSDFRHGIFNRDTIPLLSAAIPSNVFKVADSQVASRWGNILEFQGFDLLTPNEREARFALGDQDSVVRPLARELYRQSACKSLFLKCGSRGMMVYRSLNENDMRAFFVIESFAERVVDAVGAGDALLAYSTLAMVSTKNEVISAILGSIAAGIECEHEGNWLVTPDQILKRIDSIEKIVNYK